jgi:hypothetical protein
MKKNKKIPIFRVGSDQLGNYIYSFAPIKAKIVAGKT